MATPSLHADPPPRIVREPNGIQYLTADQLGKGGFAICFRAEQCENNKPSGKAVALKIVKSQMEPQKLAQKFVTELQLHSKLRHPNIVEFFRAFSFEKSTYVVLEICDNGSLADALRKRKFFSMPEIRRFLVQICGAVKYLHYRNIVHRDLKTGNLFLDKDMNIKVGDFGLAAVLVGKNEVGLRRTTMCGTPNYLAPEILEKHGKGHNEKVDLWAIGIIAYTLAVGKAPFHASKREEIYKKLQQREYSWPDLRKHQNLISLDLQDLVGSLLVDEDNRPVPDQIVSHRFFKLHWIPQTLSSSCTSVAPIFPEMSPPGPAEITQGYSHSWFQACRQSGVGEYAPGNMFSVIGLSTITSIVKEIEREIKASRAPTVPIPSGTVYLPFVMKHKEKAAHRPQILGDISEEKSSSQSPQLTEISGNAIADSTTRLLPRRVPSRRCKENVAPEEANAAQSTIRRANSTKMALPARPRREISASKTQAHQEPQAVAPPRPIRTASQTLRAPRDQPAKRRERSPLEQQVSALPQRASPAIRETSSQIMIRTNDPHHTVLRAQQLRDRIASSLRTALDTGKQPTRTAQLPFVSKWVDYAKKFGVGYVLADGTIGCAFNATSEQPVTHVVVRNGYQYLENKSSTDRKSMSQVPMEFFHVDRKGGLQIAEPEGDARKRNVVMWAKFGRYMCQTLSTNNDREKSTDKDSKPHGPIVRYYQRLGTVGVWGFSDGALQINFPDHTKLVISADSEQCSFTCFSVESMNYLKDHGNLPMKHIKSRDVLTGSLTYLVNNLEVSQQTHANLLRKKLDFIHKVLSLWVAGGGLGCRPQDTQWPIWNGPKLDGAGGKKIDWVTVGRFGGDVVETPPSE